MSVGVGSFAHADIATGLIGHWRLDENSGGAGTTINDFSPTNADGTLAGTPTWVADNLGGFGLQWTAANQHVDIGDVAAYDLGTSNFTVALWVKGDYASGYLLCKDASAGSGNGLYLYRVGNSTYGYWNGAITIQWAPPTTDTGWHHLVVVRSGTGSSQLQLYTDNVAGNINTDGRTLTNATSLRIGGCSDVSGATSGTIGDVRIWNRALTTGDITEAFQWTTPPTSTRKRLWHME